MQQSHSLRSRLAGMIIALMLSLGFSGMLATPAHAAGVELSYDADTNWATQWMLDTSKIRYENMTSVQTPTNYVWQQALDQNGTSLYRLLYKAKNVDDTAYEETFSFDKPLQVTFKDAIIKTDLTRTDLTLEIDYDGELIAKNQANNFPGNKMYFSPLTLTPDNDNNSTALQLVPLVVSTDPTDLPKKQTNSSNEMQYRTLNTYDIKLSSSATGKGWFRAIDIDACGAKKSETSGGYTNAGFANADTSSGGCVFNDGSSDTDTYVESYTLVSGFDSPVKIFHGLDGVKESTLSLDGNRIYATAASGNKDTESHFDAMMNPTAQFKYTITGNSGGSVFSKTPSHTVKNTSDSGSKFVTSDGSDTDFADGTNGYSIYFKPTYKVKAEQGYKLTSLKVDGADVALTGETEQEYTFDPLRADHEIVVTSVPQVTYKYTDTEGNALPEEVLNAVTQVPEKNYPEVMGGNVATPTLETAQHEMADGSGLWRLTEKPTDATNVTEPTEVTYVWEFVPYETKFVDEDGTEIDDSEDGTTSQHDITNYKYVKTETSTDETTGKKTTTHIYRLLTTSFVDEDGNAVKNPEDGTQPKNHFNDEGWEYVSTSTDEHGNTTHVYRKIPVTVTYKFADTEGNPLPAEVLENVAQVPGDKNTTWGSDVATPQLEEDKTTYEMPDGSGTWKLKTTPPDLTDVKENTTVTYVWEFVPNHTTWVDEDGNELVPGEDGTKDPKDITNYGLTETTTVTNDDGSTTTVYVYKKLITSFVDENGKQLLDPKDGVQPKETITDYDYVKTVKDDSGNITHIYKPAKDEDKLPPTGASGIGGALIGALALGLGGASLIALRRKQS